MGAVITRDIVVEDLEIRVCDGFRVGVYEFQFEGVNFANSGYWLP